MINFRVLCLKKRAHTILKMTIFNVNLSPKMMLNCDTVILQFDNGIVQTPIVNDVIGCVAHTSKVLEEIKKPDSLNLLEKSDLVHTKGLEPPPLRTRS